jgi:hypothetical protein
MYHYQNNDEASARRSLLRIARAATMLAVVALAGASISACGSASRPAQATARGTIVASSQIRRVDDTRNVVKELDDAGFDHDTSMVQFGVELYRLEYRTIDADGHPTTATGLLALPINDDDELDVVSYTHGTEITKTAAPSVSSDPWATSPAVIYASAGFATVAPDYVGLGNGPGTHPWMDLASEVTASQDLLVAATTFAAKHGRTFHPKVFVTGFSQGALVAVAFAKSLGRGTVNSFGLAAVAPVSGPYAWNSWIDGALRGDIDPKEATVYLAYWMVTVDRVHNIYSDPAEVFRAPFDKQVESWFDGTHEGGEVVDMLPGSPAALFTPNGIEMLRERTGNMATAVAATSGTCTGWQTRIPVRLYTASGDYSVAKSNATHCHNQLTAAGLEASVVDIGDVDHLASNQRTPTLIATWFTSLLTTARAGSST